MKLSVVINTWNEEKNIKRCISSLTSLADEIVVVDMQSTDQTVKLAKSMGARVYTHTFTNYVEPARNFAIDKARGEWILILDADEEVPPGLRQRIKNIIVDPDDYTFFRLPRKNISFGKWIKHGLWWPDYQIRLFRKGYVEWREEIHSVPYTRGDGMDLPAKEEYAVVHYNYQSISQFIERLNRYTSQQAKEKQKKGERFFWLDIIKAPCQEFSRRFFLAEGYKDGLHGLNLCLLQAFSEFIVQLKIWQTEGFPRVGKGTLKKQLPRIISQQSNELHYWLVKHQFIEDLRAKLKSIIS